MADAGVCDLAQKPTHLLSYGQKKRVCIAGVLAMEPEVIIFDEPTAYLDPKHSHILLGTLDELHQSGKQVIVSTHDPDLAYSWADYVLIIKDGKLLEAGSRKKFSWMMKSLSKPILKSPYCWKYLKFCSKKALLAKNTLKP